jgi:4'-phosphopantetheinyl transferase
MTPVIYILDISSLDPDQPGLERWIDASRLTAAAHFSLKKDRARCIGAGLLLAQAIRRIHPAYTLPPTTAIGPYGKPFLADLPKFHFNLAHSGEWAVCAVADHPVGIDIEHLPYMADVIDVAQRCFTPNEQCHLFTLPEIDQPATFCKLWTIKESYAKATGLGFQLAPEQLDIQFGPPIILYHNGIPAPCRIVIQPFPDPAYRMALAQLPGLSL